MPPKAKFTKEQITAAALDVVRENGFDALSARAVAAALDSSARPIFTVFDGMDELVLAVEDAARRIYERYESESMDCEHPFKGSGMGYIRFAMDEPKLFRFLFMREADSVAGAADVLGKIDGYYETVLRSVMDEFGVDRETAHAIYLDMWIYTHGIASLIATGVCEFTEDEANERLASVGRGVIMNGIAKYRGGAK